MRRSQWLTDRHILSNWKTDTESEARRKVSLSRSTETLSSSPLLMGEGPQVLGLAVFGGQDIPLSQSESSVFLDIDELRDHWLGKRSIHSNWRTSRQNEENRMVSLSNQLGSLSASPLLFDGLPYCVGMAPFGIELFSTSHSAYSILEDLLDTLATEDLDPIVTEDEGDEIALG